MLVLLLQVVFVMRDHLSDYHGFPLLEGLLHDAVEVRVHNALHLLRGNFSVHQTLFLLISAQLIQLYRELHRKLQLSWFRH